MPIIAASAVPAALTALVVSFAGPAAAVSPVGVATPAVEKGSGFFWVVVKFELFCASSGADAAELNRALLSVMPGVAAVDPAVQLGVWTIVSELFCTGSGVGVAELNCALLSAVAVVAAVDPAVQPGAWTIASALFCTSSGAGVAELNCALLSVVPVVAEVDPAVQSGVWAVA
ncbi:MAG: hypothetical protein ACLQVY_23795, partial [Limisphaerales bacterium]